MNYADLRHGRTSSVAAHVTQLLTGWSRSYSNHVPFTAQQVCGTNCRKILPCQPTLPLLWATDASVFHTLIILIKLSSNMQTMFFNISWSSLPSCFSTYLKTLLQGMTYRILPNKRAYLNKRTPDFWLWLALSQTLLNWSESNFQHSHLKVKEFSPHWKFHWNQKRISTHLHSCIRSPHASANCQRMSLSMREYSRSLVTHPVIPSLSDILLNAWMTISVYFILPEELRMSGKWSNFWQIPEIWHPGARKVADSHADLGYPTLQCYLTESRSLEWWKGDWFKQQGWGFAVMETNGLVIGTQNGIRLQVGHETLQSWQEDNTTVHTILALLMYFLAQMYVSDWKPVFMLTQKTCVHTWKFSLGRNFPPLRFAWGWGPGTPLLKFLAQTLQTYVTFHTKVEMCIHLHVLTIWLNL